MLDRYDQTLWALNWDRADDEFVEHYYQSPARDEYSATTTNARIWHYIATNRYLKGARQYTARFTAIFEKAGARLNDGMNYIELSDAASRLHRGRHTHAYHDRIMEFVTAAEKRFDDAGTPEAIAHNRKLLEAALRDAAKWIESLAVQGKSAFNI